MIWYIIAGIISLFFLLGTTCEYIKTIKGKIKAANNNIQKRDENPRAVNDYYLTEYKGPQDQQQKVPKKGKKTMDYCSSCNTFCRIWTYLS